MLTNSFLGADVSRLGFGAMRFPLKDDGNVDEAQVDKMIDYAMAHGVNYFDTAWPYHAGRSEIILGRSLARYPRTSWHLADKYPGHQIAHSYDPAAVFERQLEKCGVEYFDYYLLHNVYDLSLQVYTDPRWGILEYFQAQKRLGRIRHLGFSCHGHIPTLERFLDLTGETMEFCQIQLNYLDWTLQRAREKYELLTERGIPVIVMEPVRGGRLAQLPDGAKRHLEPLVRKETPAAWAFRFVQDLPNVKVILSGMSSMEQMVENVATFEEEKPLSEVERKALLAMAEDLKGSIPCTGCRYCVDSCPMGLDIPKLISVCNELRFAPSVNSAMALDSLPPEKRPEACLACGACSRMCPQSIDIPAALAELVQAVRKMPTWAELCHQREEEAKRLG